MNDSHPEPANPAPANPGTGEPAPPTGRPARLAGRMIGLIAVLWAGYHRVRAALDSLAASARADIFLQMQRDATASTARWLLSQPLPLLPSLRSQSQVLDCAARYAAQSMPGAIAIELGVATGKTIRRIARHFDRVYGFDSWSGLPTDWTETVRCGAFGNVPMPQVPGNVRLIKGWFHETLPAFAHEQHHQKCGLLHVDCDLGASARDGFGALSALLRPGSVIVFDEYFNYPGWESQEHQAFREHLDATPSYSARLLTYNRRGNQAAFLLVPKQPNPNAPKTPATPPAGS